MFLQGFDYTAAHVAIIQPVDVIHSSRTEDVYLKEFVSHDIHPGKKEAVRPQLWADASGYVAVRLGEFSFPGCAPHMNVGPHIPLRRAAPINRGLISVKEWLAV